MCVTVYEGLMMHEIHEVRGSKYILFWNRWFQYTRKEFDFKEISDDTHFGDFG